MSRSTRYNRQYRPLNFAPKTGNTYRSFSLVRKLVQTEGVTEAFDQLGLTILERAKRTETRVGLRAQNRRGVTILGRSSLLYANRKSSSFKATNTEDLQAELLGSMPPSASKRLRLPTLGLIVLGNLKEKNLLSLAIELGSPEIKNEHELAVDVVNNISSLHLRASRYPAHLTIAKYPSEIPKPTINALTKLVPPHLTVQHVEIADHTQNWQLQPY